MIFKTHDVIKSRKVLSSKINKNCLGTILYIYEGTPKGYEIEFVDSKGDTLDILTVGKDDIEHT